MATKKQVEARNQEKGRGRVAKPSVGNFKSVLNAMQHVEDKKSVRAAQELERCNELMFELALGEGTLGEKAGVKDRLMAIRWVQDVAKEYLEDYYETLDQDDSGEKSDSEQEEVKANGTTGEVFSLVSTDYD